MAEPYIGEIRIFGFTFAPKDWALCDGQLLSIQQNADLFSLIKNTYGGDGITTFALPDLRGRIPVYNGSTYTIGQKFGEEYVRLSSTQIPKHNHNLYAIDKKSDTYDPTGCALCKAYHKKTEGGVVTEIAAKMYEKDANTTNSINSFSTTTVGGKAHYNMQPSLVLNFCISLKGFYPQRN